METKTIRGKPRSKVGPTVSVGIAVDLAKKVAVIATARGCYQADYLHDLISDRIEKDYDDAVRSLSR